MRLLVVIDDSLRGKEVLALAAEEALKKRARIDLVGVARPRRLVWALARSSPYVIDLDELEQEELRDFAATMRAAVSTLPADVGVTVQLRKGRRRRVARELMATGNYQRLLV